MDNENFYIYFINIVKLLFKITFIKLYIIGFLKIYKKYSFRGN